MTYSELKLSAIQCNTHTKRDLLGKARWTRTVSVCGHQMPKIMCPACPSPLGQNLTSVLAVPPFFVLLHTRNRESLEKKVPKEGWFVLASELWESDPRETGDSGNDNQTKKLWCAHDNFVFLRAFLQANRWRM